MRPRFGFTVFALASALVTSAAAKAPVEWDGLQRVDSKRFDFVYLQPGADFRGYSKVMVEPTEISFRKNWQRDYNSSTRGLGGRLSDDDVQRAIVEGMKAATDIFKDAWKKGGYAIVDTPGSDVLTVRTAVANVTVNAPDVRSSSRSYTFSEEAGSGTLIIEVRDSSTGALLGRVVDQRIVGDSGALWRTSGSNRMDFREVAEAWAKDAVRGMAELKALSPGR